MTLLVKMPKPTHLIDPLTLQPLDTTHNLFGQRPLKLAAVS